MPQRSRRPTGLIAAAAVTAVAAALTASWVVHRARRAERRHPPEGSFVEVDGVRLHYIDRGDGPAIVLFHGNLVPLQDAEASGLVEELARTNRVIVFDRPGFGFSDRPRRRLWTARAQAELFDAALRKLGVADAIVMGHSWGTLIALELALMPGSLARKLVLVSGYYFPSVRPDVLVASPPAIPVLGDILRYTLSPLTARLFLRSTIRKMFAPDPVPPGYLRDVPRELLVRPSQIRATSEDAVFMIPSAGTASKRYGQIEIPVVILAGADDQVISPDRQSGKLEQTLRHARLRIVPSAGHMLHHAHRSEVIDAIRNEGLAPTRRLRALGTTDGGAAANDQASEVPWSRPAPL
jgi:pimeloyl-ACP methyl ester carboxylesterase